MNTSRIFDAFRAKLFAPLRLCGKTQRAQNDYATHLPVLIGLAMLRPVERVLELGSGNYSTKTFLDRTIFPDLKQLLSLETDPIWFATMRASVSYDSRCKLTLINSAMADAVSTLDLNTFDLIFIDDSTSAEQRAATIRAIAALHPTNPWIVIHDYEVDQYRDAASAFTHRFAFKAYNPHTGLVFNGANSRRNQLKVLAQRLNANSPPLEPDDVAAWTDAVRRR